MSVSSTAPGQKPREQQSSPVSKLYQKVVDWISNTHFRTTDVQKEAERPSNRNADEGNHPCILPGSLWTSVMSKSPYSLPCRE